jgi:predicted enzyme related to lactoylglutathione lyase
MPAASQGRYLIARVRGGDVAAVSPQPDGAPPQAVWNTYIWVEDADEAAATSREAGGTVLGEPFDVMDAGRMAVLADPEGAAFCAWQAREHRGAQIVNEPGALNFNPLNTRDPEVAKRFYGALFGWATLDLGSGEFSTLRAYGDYLEELTPGVRERTAHLAAAGFEDVVAAITPIAGDETDTDASWSVTFSTDDADATAAKAAEARRHSARRSGRRTVLAADPPPRPAGGDVLRHGVRAREQERRPRGRLSGPGNRWRSRPRAARLGPRRRLAQTQSAQHCQLKPRLGMSSQLTT